MDLGTEPGRVDGPGEVEAGGSPGRLRPFVVIGACLLCLVVVDSQILPRIEGSAEPAIVSLGPWSVPPLPPRIVVGDGTPLVVFLALGILAVSSGLYAVALALAGSARPRALVVVLAVTALIGAVVVASPPARGSDLFYYAFQGRMIERAGLNPYVEPPRALEQDAWFPFVSPVWRDLTTGYGPVWLLATAGVDRAFDSGGAAPDFVAVVVAFKALFAALAVANAYLIWLILGDLAPPRRLAGTIAYAWNPTVLLVGAEHNDTIMLTFALVGVWLHLRGRRSLAIVGFTLSALVKYYTAPLLIAYLVWQWRTNRDREGHLFFALAGMVALLAIAPFNLLDIATHYPTYLVESGRLARVEQAPLALLVVLAVAVGVRFKRLPTILSLEPVLAISVLALVAYLAFLSRDRFPWYIVTVLGLSALLGGRWVGAAAAAGASWLLGLHEGTAYLADLSQRTLGIAPPSALGIILFGPALAVCAADALWSWRRWQRRPLFFGGLAALVALTAGIESPLVDNWSAPAPLADLGVGRAPGPTVIGTTLEWDDWSWGVSIDQVGTPAGPSGPRSVCLTYSEGYGALFAHHPGFSTRDYQAIEIDLGPAGASQGSLALALHGADGQTLGTIPLASYLDSGQAVGGWKRVRVPISALGASDATVTGVLIQNQGQATGGTRATCLQRVVFVPATR